MGTWNRGRAPNGSTATVLASIVGLSILLANPQSAFAACSTSGVDPVTVTCAANTSTTSSTNSTSPNASTSDSIQRFNADLIGQVNGGVTIDTFGLTLVTMNGAGGVAFTNSGVVTNNQISSTLALVGNGGAVTYGGTGAVTNTGSGGGLSLSNLAAGTITATPSGAVSSTTSAAITAIGIDGLVTVNGQGAINGGGVGGIGIVAQSNGTGGIIVSTNAAGTINATHDGILVNGGTDGNISITTAGVIGGGTPVGDFGILVGNFGPSAGTVAVTANANISAMTVGILVNDAGIGGVTVTGNGDINGGSQGIRATQLNNAAGTSANVHVGGTGDTVAATDVGISARITGANNVGNVLVDRTGNVTGVGGISATTVGGGNVTVSGVGTVNGGNGTGINATSSGGNGNVIVTPAGSVTSRFGINASTAGNGKVTVTAAAVTSTSGDGISATGVNGVVAVNGQGAIRATGGTGIVAVSTGTGGVTVSTNAAATINATNIGVFAESTGTAGNVSITTAGVIGGGTPVRRGIHTEISNASNAGTLTVTANANVVASNQEAGILAFHAGTGNMTVDGTGSVTGQNGIAARQGNNAAGTNASIHIGGSGNTTGTAGIGLVTDIIGANNIGNVLVDRTGNVTGFGGISATTVGGGNVTVTGVGTVNGGAGAGIVAISSGGNGNVIVAPVGSVTGNTGIFASAAGTGTANVTITNSLTGTSGTAVQLRGANNLFTMSGPAAALTGRAIGSGTDTFRLSGAGTNTFDVSQIGAGWSLLNKAGLSAWTLTGNAAYPGPTTVDAGTLLVNGSLASASGLTVNAGATLGGTGTVGNTAINSGTLAPGAPPGNLFGPLTVQGSLSFTAASTYMIQVSPANAGRTNVTGMATLGGATVNASFLPGFNVSRRYTIVHATGGVADTFNPVVSSNLANIQSTLSYDANNVYLNTALVFAVPSGGLSINQQNVATTLTNFFNTTGGIPVAFATLNAAGLTQVSGEAATGSQQTTFNAMSQFMGLLTDPFIAGRGDGVSSSGGAAGFAEENDAALAYADGRKPRTASEREAYAAVYRKAPVAEAFAQRWSVWAAGFGGSQTTDGNATLGSNTATSRIYGAAAGADYRFLPFTLAGFALAGGGTNFSVANAGTGRSDLFQAGAFIRHTFGPAYLSAALAYGWQDITTDRTLTIAGFDQLRAKFNANAWSGRAEGGYRFVTPWMGLTPYAAGQFVTFELPNYAETVVAGANTFALGYAAKSVTATRSELGLRSDKSFAIQDAILTLRGRAAWAHDYNPDRSIAATFQTLPDASFVVNGAAQARNAALTTASAEIKWLNGFSLAGTFEGEFSDVTRSYASKAVARYVW
jgi:uncharacterized protein with beta-barrel porin domain